MTILYLPTWSTIQEGDPELADRILAEYNRVGGFIPYEQGYVYAIQAAGTNYFKFGKTKNPDRRILRIAPQMPFPTRYVKVWRSNFMSIAEKWMHKEFAKHRVNGEWFELPDLQRDGLFFEFDYAYNEQILDAYGSLFWEAVLNSEKEFSSFKEYIFNASDGTTYLGFWGGNGDSIHLIESLFFEIGEELSAVSEDLRANYKKKIRAGIESARSASDQNGGADQ